MLVTVPLCADVIYIPDPNLERVLREAMELQPGDDITKQRMAELDALNASNQRIEQLIGLEFAVSLRDLRLGHNKISDLTPIASLTKLERLYLQVALVSDLRPLRGLAQLADLDLSGCKIVDVSPLSNLTRLLGLNLTWNRITDVRPLANLINLDRLFLASNRITDVRPLANLVKLERLHIDYNFINDHSPLDGLSLSVFTYDQSCEMEPLPLEPRLTNRTYPSTFGGEWLYGPDSRIDLLYGGSFFGMYPRADGRVVGNFEQGLKARDDFIADNPNAVFLMALLEMKGAPIHYWGEEWPYWVRDSDGNIVPDGPLAPDIGLVNFTHPEVQDLIVQQAISVSKCGLFDGIVFDWWRDENDVLQGWVSVEAQLQARLNILQRIRAVTRPNFLIQVNSNWLKIPHTGHYINGLSMETGMPAWYSTVDELENALRLAESTLLWAEENLREPNINGVAGQGIFTEPADSAFNRRWVRVVTTLSLTHADGYALYQRAWGDWYDFLEADLGYPIGGTAQLYEERPGLFIRKFTNGWAVYNRSGKPQTIRLPEEVQGVASNLVGTEHTLPNLDGEMYLRVKPVNPADLNGDGIVNILDLTLVAQAMGTDKRQGDVNGDGVVNVFDLVFVANQF